MNITSISNIGQLDNGAIKSIDKTITDRTATFDNMFQAALDLVKDTNAYTNAAEEAEMSYALGLTTNTHDLQVAQQKANLSLQYTVAVRNAVMDAYKEIMNLQF